MTIKNNGKQIQITCTYLQDDTGHHYANINAREEEEEIDDWEEEKNIINYNNPTDTYLFSQNEKFSTQEQVVKEIDIDNKDKNVLIWLL